MDAPPVQYVTTSDGVRIAYTVTGAGPPLILVGRALGGMALTWRFNADWVKGLSASFQLIHYDLWGHGLSERGLRGRLQPRDDEKAISALIERLNLERVVLFGIGGVGHVAIRYAATYAERVRAVIVSGTTIAVSTPSFFREVASENWEFFLRSLVPSSLNPEESRQWYEVLKASTDYDDWQVRGLVATASNIQEDLPKVIAPTLVLHPRGIRSASLEEATTLAAALPNARLVVTGGDTALGDATEGIAAVERFLGEIPSERSAAPRGVDGLSAREMDVLKLIAAGRTNPEIAAALFISRNTVQNHVASILTKAGLANRAEAAAYAARNGLS